MVLQKSKSLTQLCVTCKIMHKVHFILPQKKKISKSVKIIENVSQKSEVSYEKISILYFHMPLGLVFCMLCSDVPKSVQIQFANFVYLHFLRCHSACLFLEHKSGLFINPFCSFSSVFFCLIYSFLVPFVFFLSLSVFFSTSVLSDLYL